MDLPQDLDLSDYQLLIGSTEREQAPAGARIEMRPYEAWLLQAGTQQPD